MLPSLVTLRRAWKLALVVVAAAVGCANGHGHPGNGPDGGNNPVADASADAAPSAILPYGQCASGDPRAKFLTEEMPSFYASGQATVSVTFANCSGATWTAATSLGGAGVKLGAPETAIEWLWGTSRALLPGDVPHDSAVKIVFTVVAPVMMGSYPYQWGLLDENVQWFTDNYSPRHDAAVAANPTTLCPGVVVERGGASSAAEGIQACINALPSGGTLELPPGYYRMGTAIQLDRPMTLVTTGTAGVAAGCYQTGGPPCAVLRAAPDLNVENGFFQMTSGSVIVDHITLDGNRGERLGSAPAATCAGGYNRRGFNATSHGDGNQFHYSASIFALCGTGMEWSGSLGDIRGSLFWGNGDHNHHGMWADGLTVGEGHLSNVIGNTFIDNSDIDLILGDAWMSTVAYNTIRQTNQASFGGLMLDNFNGATTGNFDGAKVNANNIDCGNLLCDFGINLGPHAWYLSASIHGGEVSGNTITGGKIGLNADGAGTAAAPIRVFSNNISGSPGSAAFGCGVRTTGNLNIAPDAVIDRNGDTTPAIAVTHHVCP